MLDMTRTRIDDSTTINVSEGSAFIEEGAMLCVDPSFFDGTNVSAGIMAATTSASAFAGVAYSYYTIPSTDTNVETITVPSTSPFTVSLVNTPASGYTMLVKDTTGTVYTAGTVGQGKYSISGNTFTFDSTAAGLTVNVLYRWNITVAQAQFRYGDGVAGRSVPADVTGTIGVIRRGVVSTSCFNTGVDYSTNPTLYIGANGLIDPTATSGIKVNGYVISPPTVDQNTLTFYFSA